MKPTPSNQDISVQALIKKYPVKIDDSKSESLNPLKQKTTELINQINDELSGHKTKRYSNYVNMAMIAEQFNIE